jgi:hypothetical protein
VLGEHRGEGGWRRDGAPTGELSRPA